MMIHVYLILKSREPEAIEFSLLILRQFDSLRLVNWARLVPLGNFIRRPFGSIGVKPGLAEQPANPAKYKPHPLTKRARENKSARAVATGQEEPI